MGTSFIKDFLYSNSDFIIIIIVPVIILSIILIVCKKYNFSILPEDLKGKTPIKFIIPKLTRKVQSKSYKWEVEDN
jgi:heme/copper-type cytochrome/quinol oxidase subunit 2